jgi:hypothetical protein
MGVFIGEKMQSGGMNSITMLTPRDKAVQMLFKDSDTQKTVLLLRTQGAETCGQFVVNNVRGEDITLRSIRLWMPPVTPLDTISGG